MEDLLYFSLAIVWSLLTFKLCWFDQQSGVHHAVNPDPYRGVFGADGEKYANDVQDLIDFGTSGHVAGFMCEAIQVCYLLPTQSITNLFIAT